MVRIVKLRAGSGIVVGDAVSVASGPAPDMPTVIVRLNQAAAQLNAQIDASVDERACPTCEVPAGIRCRHLRTGTPIETPHQARHGVPFR